MLNVFGKWVGVATIVAASVGAGSAFAGGWRDNYRTRVVSEVRAGPADYHKVYGGIAQTTVTIEDFWLRTADGKVIKVMTNYITLDLNNLNGFGKGIEIDTRNTTFPRGVSELDVVEIETKIVNLKGREHRIVWGRGGGTPYDGGSCLIKTPKFLNLYTSPANPQGFKMGKDVYLVKVDYSALNAIQLDIVTQKIQREECGGCFKSWFGHRHEDDDDCDAVGKPKYKKVMRCELANRRHPIVNILLKRNEF